MEAFDWQRMLLDELPPAFLGEVATRALFAYLAVFTFLKISGRRGVGQLSLFELVVILTLGSAAGDVSFYEDVPLLPIIVVFVTLLVLYRLTTWIMEHSARFGSWVEGDPVVIIRDGLYDLDALNRHNISGDEFFMELRQRGVEHLGQVRLGILEVNGEVSLYFFDSDSVHAGLSVLPAQVRQDHTQIPDTDMYACSHCGNTQRLVTGTITQCARCGHGSWSKALDSKRGH